MTKKIRALVLLLLIGCPTSLLCAQSWKFIVYGDTRTNNDAHRSVLQAMNKNTPDYEFIISTGDVVERGSRTSEWETWQAAVNDVLGGIGQHEDPPKYIAAPGNHDDVPGEGDTNWVRYLPSQQRYGNGGRFFSFDHKDARFIILNSQRESLTDSQRTMLLGALQKEPKKWLFAFWHKPIFPFGKKKYEAEIHTEWGIPLYQHGCDVIFAGHAHYYARTKKVELNGEMNPPIDELKGTVQLITGGGGAPLYEVDSNQEDRGYLLEKALSSYGYTECTIDGDRLTMRHILADGTIFDEVTLTANPKLQLVSKTVFLTPDTQINRQIQGKDIATIDFFGFKAEADELMIVPTLQPGWTWLAAKHVPYQDRTISFFLYDGYLYGDAVFTSNFRRMRAKRDVSSLVKSNSFHIAFERGDGKDAELLIFLAAPEKKRVELTIDKSLLGIEKQLAYPLDAGEAKFLRIIKAADMPEWAPMYFKPLRSIRTQINLNQHWKFAKGDIPNAQSSTIKDATWESVTLPHTWNATDIFDNRNINDGLDIYSSYWRGIGWYRKQFTVDKTYSGKKLFIEFEAANQVADVWLNGVYLGQHIGGYLGFQFDVTKYVHFDKPNLLAVKVDNRYNYDIPPHCADFNMMGGLTRDVWLRVTERVYVVSTFVTTSEVSHEAATVKVATEVRNDADVTKDLALVTNVVNADGFIVASMKSTQRIERGATHTFAQQSNPIAYPRLWSPEEPNLYTVYSHLYDGENLVDEFPSPLGFRWFEFDAQKGFFLNGEYLKLRGANLHQDQFAMGSAVPDSLRLRDLLLLKKMGINFIRLAHYPHDRVMLDECDRLGIIIWQEIPYVNTVGREKFIENAENMMREMIRRDRNHPSVVFWGIANETAEPYLARTEVPYIRKALQALNDVAHQEDPTRLTVQAHNKLIDSSLVEITDVIGRNRYYGWYEGTIEDFGKAMDQEHKERPHWKILISEYGADAKRGFHVGNPEQFDFSETYQLLFHEGYLKQINERPWIAGGAIWNGCDFASQNKMGNIPRINEKGMLDYKRRPKDAYYFYQSQWSSEPMVYIVSHTWTHRSGPKGQAQTVRVFSNCATVELFHNSLSLGKQVGKKFQWSVPFVEGGNSLKAVATHSEGVVTDGMTVYFEFSDERKVQKNSRETGAIERD